MKISTQQTRRTFIKNIGAVASVAGLQGCAAPTNTPAMKAGSHKVLCCNIRVPLEADDKEGNGWEARKNLCADVMLAQRPDLICLQECFGNQLEDLKSRMPGFDSFGLSYPGPVFRPGNAILYSRSRYTMISGGGFWLSKTPHIAGSISWDSAISRFANWLDLKDQKSGEQFQIWNTHFDHKGQVAKVEQARVLCEGAQAPHPKNFPQILTGDLNALVTNPAIALIKDNGWTDSYAEVHGPADPGFTFHRFLGPKYGELDGKGGAGKIDFIFTRGAVQTRSAEIIRDGRNGRYPSDHYFISAELLLKAG